MMTRHKRVLICLTLLVGGTLTAERPNILFCFSDDWGRYASIYRDANRPGFNDVIETPALDRIGRSGVVFNNAFVSAPTCKPCRASVSTGMPFYRCGSNAFLHHNEYKKILAGMTDRMMGILEDTKDPRAMGDGSAFDNPPLRRPHVHTAGQKAQTAPVLTGPQAAQCR